MISELEVHESAPQLRESTSVEYLGSVIKSHNRGIQNTKHMSVLVQIHMNILTYRV